MDNSFNEDKTTGDLGESIVNFLIKSMPNWDCIKFGVENHMEDLKQIVINKINPVTKKIKSMPDFVAFNKQTGETFLIEVKYRSNGQQGKYVFNYLNEYNEYWKGTKLIIVRPNKPNFIYIDLEKIKSEMKRPIKVSREQWREYWDFNGIEEPIQNLFPDLQEETINKAIKKFLNK